MKDEESGYSETSEQPHYHYCHECDGVWEHQDDACQAPRYEKLLLSAACPMHEGLR